jgi:hypothetical protein
MLKGIEGIEYVVSATGQKKAVMIDLTHHRTLWEDFYDRLIVEQRKNEPRESLDEVRKRLHERGK